MEILTRSTSLENAEIQENTRTFTARAVPYNTPTEIWDGYTEEFSRGALEPAALGIKLRLEHETTIGVIESVEDREDGAYITAKISETTAGNDAYALLRDGALNAVSVGFQPLEDEYDPENSRHVIRKRARLHEVSLVTFPAYEGAKVEEVRNTNPEKENKVTTENPEITELRAGLDALTQEVRAAAAPAQPVMHPLAQYRSAGEYMKAYLTQPELREDPAPMGVLADSVPRPNWLEREIKLMQETLELTSLFHHTKNLPATGNTLEYPELKSNSVAVGKQAKEGDTLTTGKLDFTTKTATINTYGGYVQLSQQAVERSAASYLSTIHKAQAIAYAKEIEAATAALFKETFTAQSSSSPVTIAKAATSFTADDLTGAIIDLVEHFKKNVLYPFAGLIVSSDVFKYLATLKEDRKAFHFATQADSKHGELTVQGLGGQFLNIPVKGISSNIGTGVLAGYTSEAIEINEDGRAPIRLEDRNTTNLTQVFSVYGYAAHYAPVPHGIVPVKFTA